ncbi:HET-domain-containing protein, partial [Stipitochalara longipes BDJ]
VKLPSRLVRVSSLGEPESARLCKTSRQKGRYCALSYCWGPPGSQPLATMQDNYSAYLEKLPYNDLPKTILDAFQVTRNMGLSYIWIDSLCIIQNDAEDTQKELGKMLRIYRNAQFTISAASASNCKQGFLKVLPLQDGTDDTEGPFFLPLRVDENTMGSVLVSKGEGQWYTMRSQEQPINKRAWTLQEALLTPRLLIFTSLHMVWRCQSGFRPAPLRINFMNDTSRDTSSSHIRIWRYILQNYTNRELTKETDKLVAISAIAETFGLQSASDYLAGLWRQNLIGDLLWAVDPDNYTGLEVSNSGSPSWSWAAVKGKIQFQPSNYLGSSLEETAEVLACSVMHESVQAPFGAVRGGELIVRGYLKEMQLTSSNKLLREVQTGRRIVVEYQSDGYQYTDGYKLKFFGDRKSIQVWCLTLGNSPPDMFDVTEGGRICQAILLIRSRDYTGCYQRLGFIQDSDAPPFWWEQCEKKAVTIV